MQAGTARIGWLNISDSNGYNLRIQINFGPVVEELQWQNPENMKISGAAG